MSGYHHVEHVMGMAVSIDVHDDVLGTPGLQDVLEWLDHVDRTFSTYRSESPISQLGRGEVCLEQVSDEIRSVLLRCEGFRTATDGVFDVFAVPAPNGTTLDPSGYVKGWAIERAAAVLEAHGLANFALNAGGDVVVRGAPIPDSSWRVGIRDPLAPSALCAVVTLGGAQAVATSGSYERGAHIVDPRSGSPTAEIASVTIVGPDLGVADAYATAVFVLGVDGLAWLDGRPAYEGLVVTHGGNLHATAGMRGLAGLDGMAPATDQPPPRLKSIRSNS